MPTSLCNECGNPLEVGTPLCTECGASAAVVGAIGAQLAARGLAQEATGSRLSTASFKTCSFCGGHQKSLNKFCEHCGKPQLAENEIREVEEERRANETKQALLQEKARSQAAENGRLLADRERVQKEAKAARQRLEEAARQREEEKAARKRAQAEQAARKRVEQEENQKRAQEAEARQRAEEEAARLVAAAELERKRRETEARQHAEEEAARSLAAAEQERKRRETEARQHAEEEAARLVAAAELERKRRETEARQHAEEEAARSLAAAEQERKRRETEARQRAEEEAARLVAAAERERMRREAEARQHAEEETRLLAVQKARELQEAETRQRAAEANRQSTAAKAIRQRAKEGNDQPNVKPARAQAQEDARPTAAETLRLTTLAVPSMTPDTIVVVEPKSLIQSVSDRITQDRSSKGVTLEPTSVEAESTYADSGDPAYVPGLSFSTLGSARRRGGAWIVSGAVIVSLGIVLAIILLSGEAKHTPPTDKPPPPSLPLPPAGMVYIPGGEFLMGRDHEPGVDVYEKPAHKVRVESFFMDVYEVTCEQYQRFIEATGHKTPPQWANGTSPAGAARKPVTGVDWHDANAYAQWARKRLPTEAEWEYSARGTTGWRYPWGNDWKAGAANANGAAPALVDVGSFPATSPFGLFDMVGNAWEWTASSIHSYPGGAIKEDELTPAEREKLKVIRGGCYLSSEQQATTTYRTGYPVSGKKYDQTGFRCAQDVPK